MELSTFRTYTAWHQMVNQRQYAAPADPWQLVKVPPTAITHFTNELRLNWGLGRVQGGDWDVDGTRHELRSTTLYRSLRAHFEEGVSWEDTALYQRATAQIESTGQFRGYERIEAFRQHRCAYIDELYTSINEEGYRPNEVGGHQPADDNEFERAYANHLEPLVVVGRGGKLMLTEGSHRFTIASLLDLDVLPVYVLCRHVDWQQRRDRIAAAPDGELPADLSEYRTHPDLADLLP